MPPARRATTSGGRPPHGSLTLHWYDSKATSTRRRVHVYTPPGYGASTKKYPVLYLLHGAGDNDAHWAQLGRANVIADNLLADGKLTPMVIVMTDGHAYRPQPGEQGGREKALKMFEDDLLGDVVPLVEKAYRVDTTRERRAIAGLSMGGAQSLNVGLGHADRFAWIGAFSAATMGVDTKVAALAANAAAFNKGSRLLWLRIGKDDFLLQQNRALVDSLKKAGIVHEYEEIEGAHMWGVWRRRSRTSCRGCSSPPARRRPRRRRRRQAARLPVIPRRQFGRGGHGGCRAIPLPPALDRHRRHLNQLARLRLLQRGSRSAASTRSSPSCASAKIASSRVSGSLSASRSTSASLTSSVSSRSKPPSPDVASRRTSTFGSRLSISNVGITPGPARSQRLRATAARTSTAPWPAARHNVAVSSAPSVPSASAAAAATVVSRSSSSGSRHGFRFARERKVRIETELRRGCRPPGAGAADGETGTRRHRRRTRRV